MDQKLRFLTFCSVVMSRKGRDGEGKSFTGKHQRKRPLGRSRDGRRILKCI
jgi:hypothetical protein